MDFCFIFSAYAVGLQITYVGLYMMNTAQPALLYLVPFTLIPAVIVGWCRGELNLLWNGFKVNMKYIQDGKALFIDYY